MPGTRRKCRCREGTRRRAWPWERRWETTARVSPGIRYLRYIRIHRWYRAMASGGPQAGVEAAEWPYLFKNLFPLKFSRLGTVEGRTSDKMTSPPAHTHTSHAEDATSSLFSTYERQYATTSTTVSTGLRQLQASAVVNPSRVGDKARQLEAQLKEAEMTLQRMDMEARSATPQSASMALVKKVKDYKRDYQTLLMDVRKMGQSGGVGGSGGGVGGGGDVAHRAELGLSGYKTEAQQQRDRLLSATDRLEQTGERIREGRKQLLETEVRCAGKLCVAWVGFRFAAWGWDASRGRLRAV